MGITVDWTLASATARRLAPAGPSLSAPAAAGAVERIRVAASQAGPIVQRVSGLIGPPGSEVVAVVDRATWSDRNVASFARILTPWLDQATAGVGGGAAVAAVGSRLTAIELGAALAWLSTKVLGQYDALAPDPDDGQLMIIAPNIVAAAEELDASLDEFALWVCLHEQTHRLQFTAVTWMPEYFRSLVDGLVANMGVDGSHLVRAIVPIARALTDVLRGRADMAAVAQAIQTPEQRLYYDQILALMTLLEGHADVMMDRVTAEELPNVEQLRQRFDRRRSNPGRLDSVARKLLAVDSKMQQYSEGAKFVREAVEAVGVEGFNWVWLHPDNVPTRSEIAEPSDWVARQRQGTVAR